MKHRTGIPFLRSASLLALGFVLVSPLAWTTPPLVPICGSPNSLDRVMAIRAAAGAKNPADIFLPILIASLCSALGAFLSVALVQRIKLGRYVRQQGDGLADIRGSLGAQIGAQGVHEVRGLELVQVGQVLDAIQGFHGQPRLEQRGRLVLRGRDRHAFIISAAGPGRGSCSARRELRRSAGASARQGTIAFCGADLPCPALPIACVKSERGERRSASCERLQQGSGFQRGLKDVRDHGAQRGRGCSQKLGAAN